MGFLLLHSDMQTRHAFPDDKEQLLQVEGRVLLVYNIFIAITVSFIPKGLLLWHMPLHVTIKRLITYSICSWNSYCMCTHEVAQIVTQKSSTAQSRNATLEIPMENVIPC